MSSNNDNNKQENISNSASVFNKVDADGYFHLIKKTQKRLRFRKLTSWLCFAVALFVILFGLYTLVEQYAYLQSAYKSITIAAILLASIGLPYVLLRTMGTLSFSHFYTQFADRYNLPELKYLIDFSMYERFKSSAFYRAAQQQNFNALDKQTVADKLQSYKKEHKISTFYRFSLIGVALALFISGSIMYTSPDGAARAFTFWQTFQKPNPYQYTITPGNATVEQGKPFKPTITFHGDSYPNEVTLAVKTEVETDYRKLQMEQAGDSVYRAASANLSNDLAYYVAMDEFRSQAYTINVQLRPRFKNLMVNVIPPTYTGLQKSTYNYPFSTVQAYRGSKLQMSGTVNKPLRTLVLNSAVRDDSTSISIDEQQHFATELNITQRDTISFTMSDEAGLKNKNQFTFTIDQLRDEPPYISINKPEGELAIPEPDSLLIEYEATDDFGFYSAALHFSINRAFVDQPIQRKIDLPTPGLNKIETFNWDLSPYTFKPRDEITYWIKVRDNDPLNNYKPAISQKLVFRIPSLTEGLDEIEEKETETQNALKDISQSYDEIQKKYEEFKNKLKQGDNNTWQQNRKLEEIKKERSELEQKVDELQKKFENLRKEMQQKDTMSEETLQAYKELEKLMKEIDDPEIMKMLEKMQESLSDLNQNELKKAMEDLEFNEKAYQERLKRTVELFKKLKMNSDLEKMARSLDNLSEQEKQLSETKDDPLTEAKKQKAIKDDLKSVEQMLEKLDENSSENNRQKVEDLKEKNKEDIQRLKNQLDKNIEELTKQAQKKNQSQKDNTGKNQGKNTESTKLEGASQPQNNEQNSETDNKSEQESEDDNENSNEQNAGERIQQQQRQIQQQMQQMAQRMRSSKQQMAQQQQQINIAALESILQSLLNQSYMQESLTKDTEELADRSKAFVEKARIQKNISQQFSQSSDSLSQVAAEIPMLSNKITEKKLEIERNLENAVEQLAERDRRKSTVAERQSLGGINELSSMIASLLDQLNSQSGQGGKGGGMSAQQMMQQMQQMGQQQQQLNQQIQQMINDMQGQRLSQDNMQRLEQMAKQQNQLRKQLEELKRSGALEPGDKLLSEFERMAEQMEESINDIRGGAVDRPLVERQQNILSRMLEAEKAMQKRGKSKKEREATSPDETPPAISPDVTIEELRKMIQKRLQDPEQTNFTKDYQDLIETYFELLQQREKINS